MHDGGPKWSAVTPLIIGNIENAGKTDDTDSRVLYQASK